jgi:sugar/nucleoside kinase (ribokinase family)
VTEILFVGHVSIDKIKNIHGEVVQPGGAALYAAMGAKTICKDIAIFSAIGEDYKFREVFDFEYPIIKRVKGESTKFFIVYDKDWNPKYKKVVIGAGAKITTKELIKVIRGNIKAIHIAPMNPPKVEKMIREIKKQYPNIIISLNSSIHYLNRSINRNSILNAANLSDIFILNEKELRALIGMDVVSEALRKIKSKIIVLTLGEIGTIINSEKGIEFIPAMTAITKNLLVDVTGAGDTWAGSFLASYIKYKDWRKAVGYASFISAIKCTGWNFEKIKNLRFNNIEEAYEFIIALKEKGRQLRLTDITDK